MIDNVLEFGPTDLQSPKNSTYLKIERNKKKMATTKKKGENDRENKKIPKRFRFTKNNRKRLNQLVICISKGIPSLKNPFNY